MKNKMQGSGGFDMLAIVVAVAVVALIGFGGWYVWQARTKSNQPKTTATSTSNQTTDQNVFKIPELGVEFEVKGGITPLYNHSIASGNWNGISYQGISLSTQQLVDKGAAEVNGGNNVCSFSDGSSSNFPLTSIEIFNSSSDALAYLQANSDSHLTAADMTTANGFFTIGSKVFYVAQGVTGGLCLQDSSFETQQWQDLHDSLMTLKAIQ